MFYLNRVNNFSFIHHTTTFIYGIDAYFCLFICLQRTVGWRRDTLHSSSIVIIMDLNNINQSQIFSKLCEEFVFWFVTLNICDGPCW